VRVRKALLFALMVVLTVTSLTIVGCGSGEEAKATLRSALDVVDVKVDEFTKAAMTSTVPELKSAKDGLAADWQAVVDAAKAVEGADVATAEKAWTDLSSAVDAMPDDASLIEAGSALLPVAQALLAEKDKLRELVGPTEE